MFDRLRPDTGNFSRLLVWLGLACVVAAFLLPWLVFRETSVLRVSEAELRGLTPGARATILDRQRLESRLERHGWVPLLLVPLGLGLVVWGSRGLRRQQSSDEQRASAELTKAQREASIDPQSDEERDEALRAEVLVEASPAVVVTTEPDPPPGPSIIDGGERTPTEAERRGLSQARMEVLRTLEGQVLQTVATLVPPGYTFRPEVSVKSASARLLLDGLMSATDQDRPDIIVDVRVTRTPQVLRNAIDRAVVNNVLYERVSGRRAFTWLIMVVEDSPGFDFLRAQRSLGIELLSDVVQVTVVTSPDEIRFVPTAG